MESKSIVWLKSYIAALAYYVFQSNFSGACVVECLGHCIRAQHWWLEVTQNMLYVL